MNVRNFCQNFKYEKYILEVEKLTHSRTLGTIRENPTNLERTSIFGWFYETAFTLEKSWALKRIVYTTMILRCKYIPKSSVTTIICHTTVGDGHIWSRLSSFRNNSNTIQVRHNLLGKLGFTERQQGIIECNLGCQGCPNYFCYLF